jgi:hypothetical protein
MQDYVDEQRDRLEAVHEIFKEAVRDVPYLIVIGVLFLTMPWRINHILRAIRDTREDSDERKAFIQLLRQIFKDYACIFMNVVLLLSGFKTRKALILIRRNYRLNFFIGFLTYSYFNELLKELRSLAFIYYDLAHFVVACLFGWTRAHLLVRALLAHKQKLHEEGESAVQNKKIYENTVKSGKELQVLNKMGFYNYINVCTYLTIPDLIALRQVDKLNYQITKREEIWFTKWEFHYSKSYNFVDEEFETRCIKAYTASRLGRKEVESYHTIIMEHFRINVEEEGVNIAAFGRERLPVHIYNRVFKDYRYRLSEGYGPENELPQEDNEDEDFLRLTNQVRRPIVDLN